MAISMNFRADTNPSAGLLNSINTAANIEARAAQDNGLLGVAGQLDDWANQEMKAARQMKLEERKAAREDAKTQDERDYKLKEEERKRGLLMDESTPEGQKFALEKKATEADIEYKKAQAQKAKIPSKKTSTYKLSPRDKMELELVQDEYERQREVLSTLDPVKDKVKYEALQNNLLKMKEKMRWISSSPEERQVMAESLRQTASKKTSEQPSAPVLNKQPTSVNKEKSYKPANPRARAAINKKGDGKMSLQELQALDNELRQIKNTLSKGGLSGRQRRSLQAKADRLEKIVQQQL